ncbi:MAG: hypothetical protein BWX80_04135 [Candidatus Hydrogenedentes bacterium ADurb.Bin101]|nr:MAG: hypothetical protein BWX80_04135 [Candidatus Hydrogenedentes bacterium ADurb.Bin101]
MADHSANTVRACYRTCCMRRRNLAIPVISYQSPKGCAPLAACYGSHSVTGVNYPVLHGSHQAPHIMIAGYRTGRITVTDSSVSILSRQTAGSAINTQFCYLARGITGRNGAAPIR